MHLANYISERKGSGKNHISILKSSLLELSISQEQTVKVKNLPQGLAVFHGHSKNKMKLHSNHQTPSGREARPF